MTSFYLGFMLDGYTKYNAENFKKHVPDSAELKVHAYPLAVEHWEEVRTHRPGDSITIFGEQVRIY